MSSRKNLEPRLLDLQRDLPTTAEDVATLRRLRYPKLSPEAYRRLLQACGSPSPEELRRRRGPRGKPFELPE